MKARKSVCLAIVCVLVCTASRPAAAAQPGSRQWEREVKAFEAADRANPPPEGAILFIGSSTIRMWKTLAQDFPEHKVLNRGFGGSQIADCTFYADRIVIPYKPRLIVLRAGGNDIHAGKTPEQVRDDFQAFVEAVRAKLPNVPIAYMAINATPARWANVEREKRANQLIKDYIQKGENLDYIDTFDATMGPDGKPREELFIKDRLHFNAEGYKILASQVRSHLAGAPARASGYARWANGPGKDAAFFPLAVWLQAPRNAPKYQAIGINLYIALWEGPTAAQIAELKRCHMPVFCEQNEYALAHLDEKTIVGWMHGDEPDNAQSLGEGKGYGPPIPPQRIVAEYRTIKEKDPSRPVMLNLGQGVAWDGWYGRGVRTNHPDDYAQYVRGGDIVSFDIYPAVHDKPEIAGKLWYVARGVERLRGWAGGQRIVWDCIECTRIGNAKAKPTPQQVKAEVWMSIIHGARGIIYFCHQFQPRFIEAGLLADEEMARAVGAINREVQGLAEVINSPSLAKAATVTVSPAEVSPDMARLLGPEGIALAVKKHQGALYLFAVRMEGSQAKGVFQFAGMSGAATARVLGEDRTIPVRDGRFEDDFGPNAVHLYKLDVAR